MGGPCDGAKRALQGQTEGRRRPVGRPRRRCLDAAVSDVANWRGIERSKERIEEAETQLGCKTIEEQEVALRIKKLFTVHYSEHNSLPIISLLSLINQLHALIKII